MLVVSLDLLAVVSLGVLGVLLVLEELGVLVVPDEAPIDAEFLLASVVVPEALVPPADCARAMPLTVSAAAAARVVNVFLIWVMMSCSLNGKPAKGSELMASRRIADWSKTIFGKGAVK